MKNLKRSRTRGKPQPSPIWPESVGSTRTHRDVLHAPLAESDAAISQQCCEFLSRPDRILAAKYDALKAFLDGLNQAIDESRPR